MKKLIVMGIVLTMILAGGAAYADATNWTIFSIVGSGTASTVSNFAAQNYYGVSTTAVDGVDTGKGDVLGGSITNTTGYIRDYGLGATSGGYGLTGDIREKFTTGTKTWSDIKIGTGGSYVGGTTPSMRLRFWAANLDATCPKITITVTNGIAGSAYETGTVLIPEWDITKSGTKGAPAYWFDLTPLIAQFNAGQTLTLQMTAAYAGQPPSDTPEPGSMVAMLSGLVGLVGFGIRRRK